jgi:hypothetical protein
MYKLKKIKIKKINDVINNNLVFIFFIGKKNKVIPIKIAITNKEF